MKQAARYNAAEVIRWTSRINFNSLIGEVSGTDYI